MHCHQTGVLSTSFSKHLEKKKEEAKGKSHQSRQTCPIWNHKEVSKLHEVLYSFWAGLPGQNYSVTCTM